MRPGTAIGGSVVMTARATPPRLPTAGSRAHRSAPAAATAAAAAGSGSTPVEQTGGGCAAGDQASTCVVNNMRAAILELRSPPAAIDFSEFSRFLFERGGISAISDAVSQFKEYAHCVGGDANGRLIRFGGERGHANDKFVNPRFYSSSTERILEVIPTIDRRYAKACATCTLSCHSLAGAPSSCQSLGG